MPAGQTLVLTDVTWAGDTASNQVHNYQIRVHGFPPLGGDWLLKGVVDTSGGGYQTFPVSEDWNPGLPFYSDQTLQVDVSWPDGHPWSFCWAGYVVPGAATGVEGQSLPATPSSSHLEQNIPNPFNPATEIRYLLDAAGEVGIAIYDSQGRHIRELERGMKEAGEHVIQWDGRNDRGEAVASGVYYYELETARGREARKAVLLR